MKLLPTFAALILSLASAPTAEPPPAADSESEQWQRIAERLRVELGVNLTELTNLLPLRSLIVHPSFGILWDEMPRPTVAGTNALAAVHQFVATNGWNMYTGTVVTFSFIKKRGKIRGLPWEAIREREFSAVTHNDVLYVILSGWHHDYSGVAYNPKTNAFPKGIRGFKHIGQHWYAWSQPEFPGTLPQEYEGQKIVRPP